MPFIAPDVPDADVWPGPALRGLISGLPVIRPLELRNPGTSTGSKAPLESREFLLGPQSKTWWYLITV